MCVKGRNRNVHPPDLYDIPFKMRIVEKIRETYGENVWVYRTPDYRRVHLPNIVVCFFGHFVTFDLQKKRQQEIRQERVFPIDKKIADIQENNRRRINLASGSAFKARDAYEAILQLERLRETLGIRYY